MNVTSKLLYFEDNLLVFIDYTDYTSLWQIILRKYNYKYHGFGFVLKTQHGGHHSYNKTSACYDLLSSKSKEDQDQQKNQQKLNILRKQSKRRSQPAGSTGRGGIQATSTKVNGTCQSNLA